MQDYACFLINIFHVFLDTLKINTTLRDMYPFVHEKIIVILCSSLC